MPLTGVKVLEVCANLAGPVAGTIFGDLGADVLKVERPGTGDDARHWAPPYWHGMGATFQAINRNKASVTLDLKREEDVARLKQLMTEADLFVHNMRPGAAEALGVGPDVARAINPRLIYCAMGAYGSKGPYRSWSAYDALAQALSGQMDANGEPDRPPLLVPGGLTDKGTGMWTAIAALGALYRRALTGQGCVIETSLLETALWWRDIGFANYQATGTVAPRAGNTTATIVPYGTFPTATGDVMIACASDTLFASFARLIGEPGWGTDPRFFTNPRRVENRDALEPLMAAALRRRPRDEWVDLLGNGGIPCAPILNVAEAFAHPQVQALGILQSPPGVDMPLICAPWTMDGVRPPVYRGAPELGADNGAGWGAGSPEKG